MVTLKGDTLVLNTWEAFNPSKATGGNPGCTLYMSLFSACISLESLSLHVIVPHSHKNRFIEKPISGDGPWWQQKEKCKIYDVVLQLDFRNNCYGTWRWVSSYKPVLHINDLIGRSQWLYKLSLSFISNGLCVHIKPQWPSCTSQEKKKKVREVVAVYRIRGKWMTFCMLNQLWNVHLIIPRNPLVYLYCSADLHFQTSTILIITSSRPPTDKKHKPPQCTTLSTNVCMFLFKSICVLGVCVCVCGLVFEKNLLFDSLTTHGVQQKYWVLVAWLHFFCVCPQRGLKYTFSGQEAKWDSLTSFVFFSSKRGYQNDWCDFSGNSIKGKHKTWKCHFFFFFLKGSQHPVWLLDKTLWALTERDEEMSAQICACCTPVFPRHKTAWVIYTYCTRSTLATLPAAVMKFRTFHHQQWILHKRVKYEFITRDEKHVTFATLNKMNGSLRHLHSHTFLWLCHAMKGIWSIGNKINDGHKALAVLT